ncbi:phage major capsid protein [Paracoccus sp. MC1862]|uniref:phage major capsid protein n=1 Tax=Paracoccus sp. MC1862 TaxID=2760307 RepID=UPI00160329A5|nr:phage major capsid protein [Paracoccus sp. MC1862]MBB1497502.1 phage major capsid protein [Paracoccus sp. MC1862]QQO45975.1 phage major capsid protein [Paracoccus sp. MC1862]
MTEVDAAGGSAMPAGLKGAMAEFVHELRAFRENVDEKLQAQDKRMTMLDRKTAFRGRSPLSQAAEIEAPHQKAFAAYLRRGDDTGLRSLALEEKAMASGTDGGYLAVPTISEAVQEVLRTTGSLRSLATVVQVEASAYEVLMDKTDIGAGWASEIPATVETDTPQVEKISIGLHELAAMPKATQRLLDDASFDLESWLAERIAEKFARAEAAAFISGNGADKPRGILSVPSAPNAAANETQVGFVATGAAGDFAAAAPANALIDMVYALGAGYRANAAFLMNSRLAGMVRRMRDGDGRYLWSDGLSAGEPARLLGYPVLISEDMPNPSPGSKSVAFGDFRKAYTIAERPDLRILRDPYSAKPHVLFYATKRVGGAVVDPRAYKLLHMGS